MKSFLLLCSLMFAVAVFAETREPARSWIFFRAQQYTAEQLAAQLSKAELNLSPRARTRRMKMRSVGNLCDQGDLPIPTEWIEQLETRGITIVHRSKILRAVSVQGAPTELTQIATLPFIDRIVAVEYSERTPQTQPQSGNTGALDWTPTEYSQPYEQLRRLNIPAVHDRGFWGQGVLVAVLDAGFNRIRQNYYDSLTPWHRAYDSLEIVATYDFVNNDRFVIDQADSGSGTHGTQTLGCIAGFAPGLYIGAAPRVQVALAKTENTVVEIPLEEDHWVAGLEWADSLGADLISSSLSYASWYPYNLRDGNHAVTTIAADLAAARGLLVINSTGNRGATAAPWISCPADGDSVLSVGSVTFDSSYVFTSSRGPTYDGRIKPDVVAVGAQVWVVSPYSTEGVMTNSGTSFACPTIAGACALLLSANQRLTPMQVIQLMRGSGHLAALPDTFQGWGVPDVNRAIDSALALAVACPPGGCAPSSLPDNYTIRAYPNPFNPALTLYFNPVQFERNIEVYDISGRFVEAMQVAAGSNSVRFQPRVTTSGTYFFRFPGAPVVKAVYLR